MDFFEAQARAKKRTTRLVALFILAIGGIVAVGYFCALGALGHLNSEVPQGHGVEYQTASTPIDLWEPELFFGILVVTLLVIGGASLFKWMQLRAGGRAVAEMVGAREISLQTTVLSERQLLNVVEEMSIAAGLPLPAVYVLDDEIAINAFAAGLTTSDAVVAVTRGTLEKLNRDELQGVVAHEFSHILNGDMRLNTRLTAVLFGILAIGLLGRTILYSLRFSQPRRGKEGNGVFVMIALGLILFVLGYVGYFFGRLIQAAVSRQREFLADASAVQFTRNPAGITNALKKIGGYSLGSSIQSSKASELSHFFFAQGFRSSFGGMWATHPPLDERIRAVDASFDGNYIAPPEVVDIAKDNWRKVTPPRPPVSAGLSDPVAIAAAIGTIEAAHMDRSRVLFDAIPAALREAAHDPAGAGAVVCGLLLDADPAIRSTQRELIKRHAGEAIATALAPLEKPLLVLAPEARLPLLLLTPPALRKLPPAELDRFLEALDELVHADKKVSLFEFCLQKVLTHHLQLATQPSGRREVYSPSQVADEISVLLSFAARLHSTDETYITQAFNAGAAQFAGIHPVVALQSAADSQLDRLDTALDKLALAYGPVKKRTIIAVATTLAYDGQSQPEDGELLRALASTLDCPMPPAI